MSERSYRDIDQTIMLTVASVNLGLALGSILVAVLCGIAFIALHVAQARGATPPRYRKSIVYAMLVLGGIVWVLSPEYENAVSPFLVYIPAFFFMFLAFYQRLCRGNGGHDVFVLFNGLALLLFSCYNAHRISIGINVLVLVLLVHAYGRPHVRWWKHILFVLLFAGLTATSLVGLHYWRSHDYRGSRAADYFERHNLMGFDPVVKLGSFESNYVGKYNREAVLRIWDTLAPTYLRAAVYEKYVAGIWKLPQDMGRPLYAARYKVDYAVFERSDSLSSADSSRPVWVQSAIDNLGFIFVPPCAVAVAVKGPDSIACHKSGMFKSAGGRMGDWYYYVPTFASFSAEDTPDSLSLLVPRALTEFIDTVASVVLPDTQDVYSVVNTIRNYFRNNFKYSLYIDKSRFRADGGREHADPLEIFWHTRAGYCEYFASLSVLLLRHRGFPARYVTGFVHPEKIEGRPYAVFRRYNSHAWVEVYDDGIWKPFDPTPAALMLGVRSPSWFSLKFESLQAHTAHVFHLLREGEWRLVLGSWQDLTQRALSNPLFYGVLVFAVVALAILLAVRVYRRRERLSGYKASLLQLIRNLDAAEKSLASLGLRRTPGETVGAFLVRCERERPELEKAASGKARERLDSALKSLREYESNRWRLR